ncbi:hypothetical protein BDFB_009457 [Asbolus verrucosus]|uniref:Uncharacterized protein n=1 Tax=Asbolus verrucosus TaxID=1661398 RepID=A0A482W158_ASBVE|nr:hypothetical protein BDFB_009457 [Asbolus verrucosus]
MVMVELIEENYYITLHRRVRGTVNMKQKLF